MELGVILKKGGGQETVHSVRLKPMNAVAGWDAMQCESEQYIDFRTFSRLNVTLNMHTRAHQRCT